MLQRVFEPFGTIRRCQLLPDNNIPGKHRGYGFIEFEDERAAVAAISRMDGFALLGRQLRVAWASNPTATPMAGGAPPSQPSLSGDTIKDAVERIQVWYWWVGSLATLVPLDELWPSIHGYLRPPCPCPYVPIY